MIALGKMGGNELNYSSDIDLMFLYYANGDTSGGPGGKISNNEFFVNAANQLTSLLSTYTTEGMCYRVDLRLRPDGSQGELCISLEAARRYYATRARDWELQMMIKARVAAGDKATGNGLLDFVVPRNLLDNTRFFRDRRTLGNARAANRKISARNRRTMRLSAADAIDVKLARGGIRDIEFLVQCLQRLYGARSHGSGTAARCWPWRVCRTRNFSVGAEYGVWHPPTNSCVNLNTAYKSPMIARRIHCLRGRTRSNCWPGECPPEAARPTGCLSRPSLPGAGPPDL